MMRALPRYGRRHAPLALVLAATACANPRIDEALVAQDLLRGMPKQTLLSCAGVPVRSAAVDNVEFLTYRSSQVTYVDRGPRFGFFGGFSEHRSAYGVGLGLPLFGTGSESYGESVACEATFTLRNGIVERIVYGGTEGPYGRLNQCYNIVENCLALLPRAPQAAPPGSLAPMPPVGAAPSG